MDEETERGGKIEGGAQWGGVRDHHVSLIDVLKKHILAAPVLCALHETRLERRAGSDWLGVGRLAVQLLALPVEQHEPGGRQCDAIENGLLHPGRGQCIGEHAPWGKHPEMEPTGSGKVSGRSKKGS